jgi:hypothetical protein
MTIGSIAYGLDHPRPIKSDEAPDFDPVFYTLDLLLPIINFGQESSFTSLTAGTSGWHTP